MEYLEKKSNSPKIYPRPAKKGHSPNACHVDLKNPEPLEDIPRPGKPGRRNMDNEHGSMMRGVMMHPPYGTVFLGRKVQWEGKEEYLAKEYNSPNITPPNPCPDKMDTVTHQMPAVIPLTIPERLQEILSPKKPRIGRRPRSSVRGVAVVMHQWFRSSGEEKG